MSLTHAILGVLEARPMSGYDVVKFFDESMAWVWSAPQSQIYPRLRAMSAEGLIEGRREIRGQKLERTVYSITDEGLAELRGWVAEHEQAPAARDPMLLRAVFFDMVPAGEAIAVLERYIEEERQMISRWLEHRDLLLAKETPLFVERLKHRPESEHDRIARLKAGIFDCKIGQAEVRLRWAEETIQLLSADAADVAPTPEPGAALRK